MKFQDFFLLELANLISRFVDKFELKMKFQDFLLELANLVSRFFGNFGVQSLD